MRHLYLMALVMLNACEAHPSIYTRIKTISFNELAAQVKTNPGVLPSLNRRVEGKTLEALPLKQTHVSATISGDVAHVQVTQTYENSFKTPIEAIYVFPLPENSAVDEMEIRVEDRVIKAEIQRRADARRIYEAAKRAGHTAALLEQERPNIFTQSVANIPAGEQVEVKIGYVQQVTYDRGEYEFVFPMVVGPRFTPSATKVPDYQRVTPPIAGNGERTGHDISLSLMIDAGLPLVDIATPTHEVDVHEEDNRVYLALKPHDKIPNRDFVMRYRLEGEETRAALMAHKRGDTGYFSLLIEPPKLDVGALVGDRELIFVVDVSGSMNGLPLGLSKAAMRQSLSRLQPSDTFNIYTFAGSTARLFEQPVPANNAHIKQALRFISSRRAGGGTMMRGAVDAALTPSVASGRHRYVFFLTDGYVSNEREIFAQSEALVKTLKDRGQRARVFALGVGSSVNRHLLDGIGRAGDGLTVYVTSREEPLEAVNRFFGYIDHMILDDVEIDWGGLKVEQLTPAPIPSLFASRPLVVRGRYQEAGEAMITIQAQHKGKPYHLPLKVKLPKAEAARPALATLWARDQIMALDRRLWAGEGGAVEEITALGLAHRIVTAYTSFVAVDSTRKVDGPSTQVHQVNEAPEGVDMRTAASNQPALASYQAQPAMLDYAELPPPIPMKDAMRRSEEMLKMEVFNRRRVRRKPRKPPPAAVRPFAPKSGVRTIRIGGRSPKPKPKLAKRPMSKELRLFKHPLKGWVKQCHVKFGGVAPIVGNIRILLQPDGKVSKARVLGRHAGTPLARCIEAKILAHRFPSFTGDPIRTNLPFKI